MYCPFPVRGFAEKRPGSRLIETAVGRVDGEVLDFRMAEWAGGFEKCLSDRAFNRPIVKNADVVSVSTKSLESILIQNNSPHEINFLSLVLMQREVSLKLFATLISKNTLLE